MENNSVIKCQNCLHCGEDENKQLACRINGNVNRLNGCTAFAPCSNEVRDKYANEILDKDNLKPAFMTLGSVVLGVLALLFFLWGFDAIGTKAIFGLAATGVLYLAVLLALFLVRRLRLKNIRKDVMNDALRTPSVDEVRNALASRNLNPELLSDGEGFRFTSHGQHYILRYDGRSMLIIHRTGSKSVDVGEIIDITESIQRAVLEVKQFVIPDPNEPNGHIVDTLCQFYIQSKLDFDHLFWEYLYCMERAVDRLYAGFDKARIEGGHDATGGENVESSPRGDIYQFEYEWLPRVLLAAVRKGELPHEALVDEEWIRGNIEKRCDDETCKRAFKSFKIKRVDSYGDYKLIIYEFPEPKFAPEAKYAAILLNLKTLDAEYYTLELSLEGLWFYCGVTPDKHLNYGQAQHTDLDHFIEWIFSMNKVVGAQTEYNEEGKKVVTTPKNVN